MKKKLNNIQIGKIFLISALSVLLFGLLSGVLASLCYIYPDFLKNSAGFSALRPLHTSSVLFWIILGACGSIYKALEILSNKNLNTNSTKLQWGLMIFALMGIIYSYFTKDFRGKEYWEFNPIWALPIVFAWIIFIVNVVNIIKTIKNWPVYIWMWLTGIIFFLFTFLENYLWLFPYFREHFITGMTIQWKVNGSIVGAWNQLLYGTAFFLMDKISNTKDTGKNKMAFFMFFLGLFNLMFNWGHHIYTLPTDLYVRYIGYAVSMTEWIFFLKIVYNWRKSVSEYQKFQHYFPYHFLLAADVWVFLNLTQALMMSIPAINIYTHGTHVTVAHAMGTTIGINTMILLAACFEFLNPDNNRFTKKLFNKIFFWMLQISLFVFWISLNIAGIKKGIWQLSENKVSFTLMMQSLQPYFSMFVIAGIGILISLFAVVGTLFFSKSKH